MGISVQTVEKWAQKKTVSKLIKALSEDSTEVRIAAIKGLGTIKDESAMNALIQILKDPDPLVRANVVEALGTIGIGRSLEFVRQVWNNDPDKDVCEKARLAVIAIKESMTKEEKH